MKIEAALTYDKIRHDQDKAAHLVISLTAPAREGEEARAPICVVPVIDISGSMRDGGKLEYAKRSAIKLIENLRPGDYTGLIAFESRTHVIIPPQKVTSETKEQMKAEVGKLRTIGGTNFAGGMLKAMEMVNALDLSDGILHRIIMLTDGDANEGQAKTKDELIKLFLANAGRVTASAFGYGNDVKQDLLGDFAAKAKGNYAFIRDPDGALTAFGKELGGLISTYATDLVLDLNALAGHEIVSVVSDVDADEEAVGGEVEIKIPEILAEERRDIILAVKLKAQKQAMPRPLNVFDVKLGFSTTTPEGKLEKKSVEVKVKAQFVKPGEENPKPNEAIDKIVALAEVIRAQIEAEEKVKIGEFTVAAAIMQNAAKGVGDRGYDGLRLAAMKTAGSVSSNASYNADQGYLRSYRMGGTRGMGVSEMEPQAACYLADAGVQLSNSSQTSTSASFAGGGSLIVGDAPHAGGLAHQGMFPVAGTSLGGGSVIPNINLDGGIVADLAGLLAQQGGMSVVTGSLPQGTPWAPGSASGHPILVAPPPVPQTDSADSKGTHAKREAARGKASHKVKKNKSSARW